MINEEYLIKLTGGSILTGDATAIVDLINTTYQPLVDAAIAWCIFHKKPNSEYMSTSTIVNLLDAIQPFLPPPKLSEELDEFAKSLPPHSGVRLKVERFADRVREMEDKHG